MGYLTNQFADSLIGRKTIRAFNCKVMILVATPVPPENPEVNASTSLDTACTLTGIHWKMFKCNKNVHVGVIIVVDIAHDDFVDVDRQRTLGERIAESYKECMKRNWHCVALRPRSTEEEKKKDRRKERGARMRT